MNKPKSYDGKNLNKIHGKYFYKKNPGETKVEYLVPYPKVIKS